MKHTPAPWYTTPVGGDHGQHLVYSENSGATVAVIYNDNGDANLIATAPDLLEALEAAITPLIHLGDFIGNEFAGKLGIEAYDRCAIIGRARDAIAKARGQS